jgi:hypothetical protein
LAMWTVTPLRSLGLQPEEVDEDRDLIRRHAARRWHALRTSGGGSAVSARRLVPSAQRTPAGAEAGVGCYDYCI